MVTKKGKKTDGSHAILTITVMSSAVVMLVLIFQRTRRAFIALTLCRSVAHPRSNRLTFFFFFLRGSDSIFVVAK